MTNRKQEARFGVWVGLSPSRWDCPPVPLSPSRWTVLSPDPRPRLRGRFQLTGRAVYYSSQVTPSAPRGSVLQQPLWRLCCRALSPVPSGGTVPLSSPLSPPVDCRLSPS
ncbi:unnamed protein product, partial [Boreogadus saida]